MFSNRSIRHVLCCKNLFILSPCKSATFSLLCHSSALVGTEINAISTEIPNLSDADAPIPNEIFRAAPKSGSYQLGDSTFYSLIHKYAELGDFGSVEKVFERMKRENRVFAERSFIAVFRAYGRAHLPHKAVELFHRMVDEFHCKRTVKSFNSVLNVIIKEGHFDRALGFFSYAVNSRDINISLNTLSFNLVICCMCKMGMVDTALQTFREMSIKSCHPDNYTYTTLMDGLCKDNRVDEAFVLLDEMQMQMEGPFPDTAIFNALLTGLCRKGDLRRAMKLREYMLLKECDPNERTYNILLHAMCMKGKLDKALSLLNEMFAKCEPNDVTYGIIIKGLVKDGKTIDGVNFLNSRVERGFRANQFVYSTLLDGLFKEKKFEEAKRLWKEMEASGFQPNTVVYTALIHGLCQEGKPDEAKEILYDMMDKGFKPNAFTYSSLLRGYFRVNSCVNALLLWKEMDEQQEHVINEVCYSVLIDGLCKEGKVDEAMVAWKSMLSKYKPDVVVYSSLIHGHCSAGFLEKGLDLYNEMLCRDPKCKPDVVTYNILFDALYKEGSIARAMDLLNSMLDRGCDPDLRTCDIFLRFLSEKLDPPQDGGEFLDELVVRLCKYERVQGASRIIEVMLRKDLPPKALTWGRALQHLWEPRKVHIAINKCWKQLFADISW